MITRFDLVGEYVMLYKRFLSGLNKQKLSYWP